MITKPWYLFSELRWDVEITSGSRAGERVSYLTAEHLALDPEFLRKQHRDRVALFAGGAACAPDAD